MIKDSLYILLLFLISLLFALIAPFGGIRFFAFQLIFAIITYFNAKSNYILIFIGVIIYLFDLIIHINPAFSLLAFATGGLIISLARNYLPLLKQQPFLFARCLWLLIGSIVLEILNLKGFAGLFTTSNIVALICSESLLILLTILIEPNFQRKKNAEISLS